MIIRQFRVVTIVNENLFKIVCVLQLQLWKICFHVKIQNRTENTTSCQLGIKVRFIILVQSLSHDRLLAPPWAVAQQASLSMGFSKQEY